MRWLSQETPTPQSQVSGSGDFGRKVSSRIESAGFEDITATVLRLPTTLLLIDLFMTWLLWRLDWRIFAIGWLVGSTVQHGTRWLIVKRWVRKRPDNIGRALRILEGFYLLQGAWRAVAVVAVFSQPIALEHQATTVLCLGVAAGAVTASGWRPRLFLCWALLVGSALVTGWTIQGGALGIGIALLILAYMQLLYRHSCAQLQAITNFLSEVIKNEEMSESLRVERNNAKAASESKSKFFAAASHDLAQPVYSLLVSLDNLEALVDAQSDASFRETTDHIRAAVSHLDASFHGVMDISQFERGTISAVVTDFNLPVLLREIRDQFADITEQRDIEFSLNCGPDDGLTIRSDRALLSRMLTNLLNNSIKFTTSGKITLALNVTQKIVRLIVEDTGPGIAADEQKKIFDEFYRIPGQSAEGFQGLGIGLSIVRLIARLLDIAIRVDSEPGRGTRFELQFSASAYLGSRPLANNEYDPVPELDTKPLEGLRVLLVDDDELARSQIYNLISKFCCDVRSTENGAGALEQLAGGFIPDVILADYRLQDETGLDVIAAVRARVGGVGAAIITADTSSETREVVRAKGYRLIYKRKSEGSATLRKELLEIAHSLENIAL